jgi:anti-anti-sigma regulatory factor
MNETASMRIFELGSGLRVITVAGDLGSEWAGRLCDRLAPDGGTQVIVDLLGARFVDAAVSESLVAAAEEAPFTLVAEPRLLHVFELTRRSRALSLSGSLAEAVAGAL